MAEVQQVQLSQLKLVGDVRLSSHSGGYHTDTVKAHTGEKGALVKKENRRWFVEERYFSNRHWLYPRISGSPNDFLINVLVH